MATQHITPFAEDEPVIAGRYSLLGVTPVATIDGGDLDVSAPLLLNLRATLATLAPGDVVELRSRNRAIAEDLAAWCRLNGNELHAALDGGDHVRFFIAKGRTAASWGTPDWGVRLHQRRPGT